MDKSKISEQDKKDAEKGKVKIVDSESGQKKVLKKLNG